MSTFARCASVAVVDAAIENDAGADARSNRGIEDVVKSTSRSPTGFGQSRGVGIVVYFNRHVIHLRDLVCQGKVAPAGKIRRIEHDTSFRVEWTRGADADAVKSAVRYGCCGHGINRRGDRLQPRFGCTVGHHRLAALREYFAFVVHKSDRNFGAANIYAKNGSAQL